MIKNPDNQIIQLLRTSVGILSSNPLVLYPFCLAAFIQLLALEVLYFAPRFPLSLFFAPIIRTIWADNFLHYPFNLVLLPKLFMYTQIPLYLFVSSFLVAVSVAIINGINSDKRVTFGSAVRQTAKQYVHVLVAALIMFAAYFALTHLYGSVVERAWAIRSEKGIFHLLKLFVIEGTPYVNSLSGILITALFAFLVPIIVIEGKKVFPAVILNFKNLRKSFWFLFAVVLLPNLLYLPILLLRNNLSAVMEGAIPELRVWVIVLSVIVLVATDAIVYTALTTYYLLKRENAP